MTLRQGEILRTPSRNARAVGRWVVAATALSSALTGCAALDGSTGGAPATILGSRVEPAGSGGNDSFDSSEFLALPSNGKAITYSDLASANDIDVFDLGPVLAGDRITLLVTAEGELDPAAALFDADGNAMIVNDDRNYFGGDWDSYIDAVVRRDTEHCYVAVAGSVKSSTAGNYSLELERTEGSEGATTPSSQVIYLNFEGATNVAIGPRDPVNVPAFEQSTIAQSWPTQIDELIELVVSRIRADFDGIDVVILSSNEQSAPTSTYSVIHFGAHDPALLGVAENVDEFNERKNQPAIVFVDTFSAFMSLDPAIEEIAQSLANVGSHEIGHLLGLNHTSDPRGIMDISASLQELLGNQAFSTSPLDYAVFPIGTQDAVKLLVEAVGGDDTVARSAGKMQRSQRSLWYDQASGPPARDQFSLSSSCGH